MRIQRIASKWQKTQILLQGPHLQVYIPETQKFSLENLNTMIHKYGLVYIKPDRGTYGQGVMSAEYNGPLTSDTSPQAEPQVPQIQEPSPLPPSYKHRYGVQTQTYLSIDELYAVLIHKIQGREYLIQQGIDMLTYQRRKFDLRVLVQKNLKGEWETTGYIGRVAAHQKIITNHHGGGTALPIEHLLGPHMNERQLQLMIQELRQIGTLVGYQLQSAYPRLKELGLDVAVDAGFKAWILEVNTLPALFPFKELKDKNIYKRIRKYAIHYGRFSRSRSASFR
ncbi:YheC/YheD family protein [Paenibacillus tuaregi]|uniref:YheC/YheD family protein n=1 Tax=Paenibacillus tuaregi TaxID=1816681 RepID=UPI00083973F2|nr:YheC/YheD family protein [Paenibacillus tuaregi]